MNHQSFSQPRQDSIPLQVKSPTHLAQSPSAQPSQIEILASKLQSIKIIQEDDQKFLEYQMIDIQFQQKMIPTDRENQELYCPQCQKIIQSKVVHQMGTWTWICGFVMFLLFLWPCFLIPCFADDCKDVHHFCSKCSTQLGVVKKI